MRSFYLLTLCGILLAIATIQLPPPPIAPGTEAVLSTLAEVSFDTRPSAPLRSLPFPPGTCVRVVGPDDDESRYLVSIENGSFAGRVGSVDAAVIKAR